MDEELVQIEVERGGKRTSVRKGVSRDEVAGLVRTFKGEPDVTLIISREGDDQRLLVAVSGAKAFVALDKGPDGLFQFIARDKQASGTQRMLIAGQETDLQSLYVLCVETAASVADEWVKGRRQSSFGAWEQK
jgi:hypothetical protein